MLRVLQRDLSAPSALVFLFEILLVQFCSNRCASSLETSGAGGGPGRPQQQLCSMRFAGNQINPGKRPLWRQMSQGAVWKHPLLLQTLFVNQEYVTLLFLIRQLFNSCENSTRVSFGQLLITSKHSQGVLEKASFEFISNKATVFGKPILGVLGRPKIKACSFMSFTLTSCAHCAQEEGLPKRRTFSGMPAVWALEFHVHGLFVQASRLQASENSTLTELHGQPI